MRRFGEIGFARALCALLLTLPLAACGGGSGGVSGVYVPTGQSLWKKLDFQSNNKVDVTNFADQTTAGEFTVMSDGRIRVIAGGDVLTLKAGSDGCLTPVAGDAQEAKTAQQWGTSDADLAELGHLCKQ